MILALRRSVVLAERLSEGEQVTFPVAEGRALSDLGRAVGDRVGLPATYNVYAG